MWIFGTCCQAGVCMSYDNPPEVASGSSYFMFLRKGVRVRSDLYDSSQCRTMPLVLVTTFMYAICEDYTSMVLLYLHNLVQIPPQPLLPYPHRPLNLLLPLPQHRLTSLQMSSLLPLLLLDLPLPLRQRLLPPLTLLSLLQSCLFFFG